MGEITDVTSVLKFMTFSHEDPNKVDEMLEEWIANQIANPESRFRIVEIQSYFSKINHHRFLIYRIRQNQSENKN